ncbi:hypothetical protein DSM106972_079680 [Dulcicalothrix desertica PCC 7102]|uniref:CRISPR type III-associated protein domain-containing protein n=1 Tax=Dulcicalothrix desertica PCC 7102 TaxID=232991 RepID=A0A433UXK9_9CYAN|nr:RAMP superfamily CRISPR-associated protein [Dulcicalothrix desertica]RUS98582.1 hypothetical protein DSM106972_079680 [Dulcicalothrix desertica PCC 7102]TWH43089.1 CRISPR/Cas system CSM-associated protein Csm3 (group 7 of RAMP superfamily) [Dulcicalothrix desertica PCC 7102]
MNYERLKHRNQRCIIERIIVRGSLVLETPACLGSGDTYSDVDLAILRDSIEDKALLMGSSVAGALRNYLHELYDGKETSLLFGAERSNDDGEQSPLIISDALSSEVIKVELRDLVKINSVRRTAEEGKKYDFEVLEAGTTFELCFELLIDSTSKREQLLQELIIVLQGLEKAEIPIGMKKRRGFGKCCVKQWQVWKFGLQDSKQRQEWLNFPHWTTGLLTEYPNNIYSSIQQAFDILPVIDDKRTRLTIEAIFTLASPLLIRSGQASVDKAPDVVHLKSRRHNQLVPILSGTSLAGVLRHRAERIVNTLHTKKSIIDEIFGADFTANKTKETKASRLIVDEVEIIDTTDLIQNRIAIDRFTGGALHGALFDEQPIFGNDNTKLVIKLELRQLNNNNDAEIGLLLLLLKDLWTGDLPVGGTSSIGRGRLQGIQANITHYKAGKPEPTLTISQSSKNEPVMVTDANALEKYVAALRKEVVA